MLNKRFWIIFLQLNGLLPFDIILEKSIRKAIPSTQNFLYCFVYFVILLIFLPICQIIIVKDINLFATGTFVMNTVFLIEVTGRDVRTIIFLANQLWNSSQFMYIINEKFELEQLWTSAYPKQQLYDRKYKIHLRRKWISSVIQILICFMIFLLYSIRRHYDIFKILCFVYIQYSNCVVSAVSSIYFWNMLMVVRLYQNLNKKIAKIVNMTNNATQKFSDIRDEIDRIAIFYSRITAHAENIIQFYSFHLMLLMIDIFASILNQVRIYFYVLTI